MHTIFLFWKRNKMLLVGTAIIALAAALYGWYRLGYAASPYEAVFMIRLHMASKDNVADIQLASAMPGEWETVCFSHPYGFGLTLPRYNKKYLSRAFPNDDGWDLFFIASDGAHLGASGNCRSSGMEIHSGESGCVTRSSARLLKVVDTTRACTVYTLIVANQDVGDIPQHRSRTKKRHLQ